MSGFATIAGSGSESLIQASRTALLRYTESLPIPKLADFCTVFCRILEQDVRNLHDAKRAISVMEVVAFLFDANVLMRLVEDEEFS